MKKQLVTALAVAGILALGACEQGSLTDELEQDVELNQETDPPADEYEEDDIEPFPPEEGNGG